MNETASIVSDGYTMFSSHPLLNASMVPSMYAASSISDSGIEYLSLKKYIDEVIIASNIIKAKVIILFGRWIFFQKFFPDLVIANK